MMRWLLVLLLLLNLGLFLWIQMSAVSTQTRAPKIIRPPGVEDILLLREAAQQQAIVADIEPEQTGIPLQDIAPLSEMGVGQEQEIQSFESVAVSESRGAEVAAEAIVAEPEPEPVCGRIGPYEDKLNAEKYQDESQHPDISLDLVETTEQVREGYWVMIPSLPSTQEARQTLNRLKAAGVKDLWRFPNGPMKNAISLGWYAGISNATRHSDNINEKGFESEVSPRMSEQTRYWLSYRTVEEQALADWLDKLSPGLQNEKKACK